MKKFWDNLTQYSRITLLSLLIGGITFIVLLVLALFNLFSVLIPVGIFLGALLNSLAYFLLSRIGNLEDDNQKVKLSMVIIIARLFLLVGLTLLEVLLERKADFSLFNPFAFVGAYLVCSTMSIIIMVVEKKKCTSA